MSKAYYTHSLDIQIRNAQSVCQSVLLNLLIEMKLLPPVPVIDFCMALSQFNSQFSVE